MELRQMEKRAVKSNGGSWGTGEQWTASLRSSTGIRNTLYNKLRKYMETNILHDHVTNVALHCRTVATEEEKQAVRTYLKGSYLFASCQRNDNGNPKVREVLARHSNNSHSN